MNKNDHFLALLVYVDDVLVKGLVEKYIVIVKSFLDTEFTIKYLGYIKY